MNFALQIQEIRRRYRPGDPLAVQAFMQKCGSPLQRIIRRALRAHSPSSQFVERIRNLVALMNGQAHGTNRTPLSVSLICQRLCASILWGDADANPTHTELFADTFFEGLRGA
jgi:hypothetical protein